jgi:16S rRNA (guanine527-N7)-methyltransferase
MDKLEFWTICSANGIFIEKEQVEMFERLHDELVYWNERINLISRKDVENIWERHFLHSLAILKYYEPPKKARCIDIGTGGGFPGVPLKIARQDLHMLLVDSIAKKIKMAGMFAQHTALRDISARTARTEELVKEPGFKKSFDVVFARAVAPLVELLDWTKDLRKPQAPLVTLKGGDLKEEIAAAKDVFKNMTVEEINISMRGAPWFEQEGKKLLICRF